MDRSTIACMSGYTKKNLKEDVENQAPKFGMPDELEARFARTALGGETLGLSHMKLAPNFRIPFGHKHAGQEEVYVVVRGSARVKVEDEIVELAEWDAIRFDKDTMRNVEAGPDGVEYLAFGAGAGPVAQSGREGSGSCYRGRCRHVGLYNGRRPVREWRCATSSELRRLLLEVASDSPAHDPGRMRRRQLLRHALEVVALEHHRRHRGGHRPPERLQARLCARTFPPLSRRVTSVSTGGLHRRPSRVHAFVVPIRVQQAIRRREGRHAQVTVLPWNWLSLSSRPRLPSSGSYTRRTDAATESQHARRTFPNTGPGETDVGRRLVNFDRDRAPAKFGRRLVSRRDRDVVADDADAGGAEA